MNKTNYCGLEELNKEIEQKEKRYETLKITFDNFEAEVQEKKAELSSLSDELAANQSLLTNELIPGRS